MTDKTQDVSDFSFRTFDIYRRFVEVLQHKPDYLKDFKTGSPNKETCLSVIKRVFQYEQEDEETKKYIEYFANHAKMMAGHAEKLPDNWNDAIDYTDRYIKEIRNYLRKKGISVRSELNSVDKIAKDIGKHIHGSPSIRQVEAIRYYLKYDLRNPKRNIVSSSVPKKAKKKSDRSSKHSAKPKATKEKVDEEQETVNVEIENDPSSSASESIQKAQTFHQISNEKESINDSNNNNNDHNETIELQPKFEPIEIEIVDDLFGTSYSSESKYTMNLDYSDNNVIKIECVAEETMKSPELSPSRNYVEMENISEAEIIEETVEIEQPTETCIENSSPTEIYERYSDNSSSSYNFHLKRKSSSPCEVDHYYSLKRQLQLCRRIPNNFHQKQFCDNSSDSEINVENKNEGEVPISKFLMMNKLEEETESIGIASDHSESSGNMKNSIFNLKSQVTDISYADAIKHLDLATTFCKLKNTISQEELSIMHHIRYKMYVKSLTERSSV